MPELTDDDLNDRVRDVLLNEWDPHNAARAGDAARATYDVYLAPIRQMLAAVADEEALADWLKEREAETMCFPSLGTRRLRRVAQKLLALRDTPVAAPPGA